MVPSHSQGITHALARVERQGSAPPKIGAQMQTCELDHLPGPRLVAFTALQLWNQETWIVRAPTARHRPRQYRRQAAQEIVRRSRCQSVLVTQSEHMLWLNTAHLQIPPRASNSLEVQIPVRT